MKTHSIFFRLTFLMLTIGLWSFSCERDVSTGAEQESSQQHVHLNQMEDSDSADQVLDDPLVGFEESVTDHVEGHGIDLDNLEQTILHHPDGTSEEVYIAEGDVAMSKQFLQQLRDMVANDAKQYRTFNLVSPQTVTVIGYTGGSYALTSKMRTALQWAINNYNALPLNLNFSLSFSSSTNADIVVYRNASNSGAGGVAGFPSGGNPYKWVQIYAGTDSYSTNVVEHVMTHEIGHCLGLRHTDYFSRASCGQNVNEGSGSDGAVHIPGTPTGIDWNSVMLACFSSSEDGEFGYYDRVALQYLY